MLVDLTRKSLLRESIRESAEERLGGKKQDEACSARRSTNVRVDPRTTSLTGMVRNPMHRWTADAGGTERDEGQMVACHGRKPEPDPCP